jgi:hypothetical protein
MAITSEQLTPWQRRLVPGLTELLFVLLFLSQLDARLFSEVTGLHLWAGLEALRHGPGLLPDTLSFTRQGALWLNPEWLGDVVLALAWRHAAYLGVAVLCALVFAGTFTWLYRILVDETNQPAVSLMVTLLAAAVAYLHLAARPSTLVLPLLLAAWELTRKPRPEWAAFALPALAALWANVHPSVLVVPLLAGYAALTHSRGPRGWIIAVLCLGALSATPTGAAWLVEIIPSSADLAFLRGIDEWKPPRLDELRFLGVWVYAAVALVARRGGAPLGRAERLLGLSVIAVSLLVVRMAPLAGVVWAPRLARDLTAHAARARGMPGAVLAVLQETLAPFERVFRPGLWPAVFGVGAILAAPCLGAFLPGVERGFSTADFPVRALTEAARLDLGPRVLNADGWGDYISWVGRGRWRVFMDARVGLYSGSVLADYLRIAGLRPGWEGALAQYRPDWLLWRNGARLAREVVDSGRWRVAYRDSLAVILTPVPPPGTAR